MSWSFRHVHRLRVRYSETDQLGTFYNSRPLEWFEVGRTELLRETGLTYAAMESRGLFLPVIEAGVKYLGRARYDDELEMTSVLSPEGKASLRFDVQIVHAGGGGNVVSGFTVHAMTDANGRPVRRPAWLDELIGGRQS